MLEIGEANPDRWHHDAGEKWEFTGLWGMGTSNNPADIQFLMVDMSAQTQNAFNGSVMRYADDGTLVS